MMHAGAFRLSLFGESLWLLPERMILWEERRTLLVADPHWGKAAAFRASGIPVPGGTTREGLRRLSGVVERSTADRVIFLGDFLHARAGRADATLRELALWRERHPDLDLRLIRGNHDREAGDPPAAMQIYCADGPVREGPFLLSHHPGRDPDGYGIAGHVHPVVRLTGPARQRQRLPCFWFGAHGAVLPSFGEFTGGAEVSPSPHDRVFVIAETTVIDVSRRP